MTTGARVARALMALAVATGLAACDNTAKAGPATTGSEATATRELQFEDTGLRDVRMTSGQALRYVHMGTAAQILCQLLDKDEWAELLDGPVGRKAAGPPNAVCQIAFSRGLVTVEMNQANHYYEATTTIAGRPAATSEAGGDGYAVALTDDAFEPRSRTSREMETLSVNVIADDEGAERDIAKAVLEEIVPLVIEEGEPLPDIDDAGYLRYEKMPLTKDFIDQPTPVQALQLCTFVREELDLDVRGVKVYYLGECRVDAAENFTIATARAFSDSEFPDEIAGRPAAISTDPVGVDVLLRDGSGVTLRVNGDDGVRIAEQFVEALTG